MDHARSQHPNAPLTPQGRRRMVACVLDRGWSIEATADRFQVDAKTVRKWRDRFLAEGDAGLLDRSSRPRRSPNRTSRAVCRRVLRLRAKRRWGADRISFEVGLAASTVQRILNEAGCGRLDRGDRATDVEPVRRYERDRPGELIHVDVKKIAAIPDGGGWRIHGRGGDTTAGHSGAGYRFIHTALDDRSRLVYSEIHNDEQAATAAGFWARTAAWSRQPRDCLRTGHHRQRALLPVPPLAPGLRRNRHRSQEDPPPPPSDQRQGRALPPDPPGGMGLHPALDLRDPTRSRLRRLRPLLQSPPTPRLARLGHHPPPPSGTTSPASTTSPRSGHSSAWWSTLGCARNETGGGRGEARPSRSNWSAGASTLDERRPQQVDQLGLDAPRRRGSRASSGSSVDVVEVVLVDVAAAGPERQAVAGGRTAGG